MPIYLLGKQPVFPPAELASPEGIVAVGGDLSSQRLLNAYAHGIFPWFSEEEPIIWWSPDPRMVLLPGQLHVSGSMKRLLRKARFRVSYDRRFGEVIDCCRQPRKDDGGTWITGEIRDSYTRLHELGYAHSVEVWRDDELVGGLYGISLGMAFFGESMFFRAPNASKFAFICLARKLFALGFLMVDCQVPNPHLKSLGATEMPRKKFLKLLKECLSYDTMIGSWDFLEELRETPELQKI